MNRSSISAAGLCELLDEGAWTFTRNEQVCQQSVRLGHEARELALTFPSLFDPMSGASDVDETSDTYVHPRLGAFASLGAVKIYARPSHGADCDVCHKKIAFGDIEYEAVSESLELRLDAGCRHLLIQELARTDPKRPQEVGSPTGVVTQAPGQADGTPATPLPRGAKGGLARAAKLTPERRRDIARKAAEARWERFRTA